MIQTYQMPLPHSAEKGEVLNRTESERPVRNHSKKQEPLLSSSEIEKRLCGVKKAKGWMKNRGLYLSDLLDKRQKFRNKIWAHSRYPTNFHEFDIRWLAMRKQGKGGKAIAKELGIQWQSVLWFFRKLGLTPLPNPNHLTEDERKERVWHDEWMKEIQSTKKDVTWASLWHSTGYLKMIQYRNDPDLRRKILDRQAKRNKRPDVRAKRNEYQRGYRPIYYKNNPSARVAESLRSRLSCALRAAISKKKISAVENLGCDIGFLIKYIETRFDDFMSWDNYGEYWHIDHIIPLSSFDLNKKSEQLKACHYTNLQPMEARENMSKNAKVESQMELCI